MIAAIVCISVVKGFKVKMLGKMKEIRKARES